MAGRRSMPGQAQSSWYRRGTKGAEDKWWHCVVSVTGQPPVLLREGHKKLVPSAPDILNSWRQHFPFTPTAGATIRRIQAPGVRLGCPS